MSPIAHLVAQTLRPATPNEPKKSGAYLGPALIERALEIEAMRERGMSNSQIAGTLGISRKTVSSVWSKYQRI